MFVCLAAVLGVLKGSGDSLVSSILQLFEDGEEQRSWQTWEGSTALAHSELFTATKVGNLGLCFRKKKICSDLDAKQYVPLTPEVVMSFS